MRSDYRTGLWVDRGPVKTTGLFARRGTLERHRRLEAARLEPHRRAAPLESHHLPTLVLDKVYGLAVCAVEHGTALQA